MNLQRILLRSPVAIMGLFLLLFSLLSSYSYGQNGRFDVQFYLKSYDCGNKKAVIQVRVRASDLAHTYRMGDANYRFEYDPRQIAHPSIVSQDNYSSGSSTPDFNYGLENLNGSSAGPTAAIVSLNTFYSGSNNGAKQVDTAWTSVASIGFDILHIDSCFKLTWHTDQTFPITGMNEVIINGQNPFDYSQANVAAGGYFGNLQICGSTACQPPGKPVVVSSKVKGDKTGPAHVCVPFTDPGVNDTAFQVSVCNAPNGAVSGLTIDKANRQICFTYLYKNGFAGTDSVCLSVCNNFGQCGSGYASVSFDPAPAAGCAGDTVAPVITYVNPALRNLRNNDTITFTCQNGIAFKASDVVAVDNKDPHPTVRFVDSSRVVGNCAPGGYKLLLLCYWIATDSCGNSSKMTIFVKIIDTIPPVISPAPANATVDLNAQQTIPAAATLTATDDCGTAIVTLKETKTGTDCNYVLTRAWTATDECGNTTTASQTITVRRSLSVSIATTAETCPRNNGTATLNPAAYNYQWSDGASGSSRTNLHSGAYQVTATQNGCAKILTVTIADSCNCIPPVASPAIANATCGGTNGTATVNVDNASLYTFAFSANNGTQNANVLTGLSAGAYTVKVARKTDPTCNSTVAFTVNNDTSACCQKFLTQNNLLIVADSCHGTGAVCVQLPYAQIGGYQINDNGAAYGGGYSACNNGTSIRLTPGDHTLIFTRQPNNCKDTMFIKVVCTVSQHIAMAMATGSTDTTCLDVSQLLGRHITVTNACTANSGERVVFHVIPGTTCVTCRAVEPGVESACFVACDEFGICDTTFVTVTVQALKSKLSPVAKADLAETLKNKPVLIDVLANDSIRGTFKSVTLATLPFHGEVLISPEGKIIYTPATDYCSGVRPDLFSYKVCNENGCDIAQVQVKVLCDQVKVYSGFSPNGDGINDFLTIEGLDTLPNNQLSIYNRWGNLVHHAENYKNDWGGKWNGRDLPEGVYFYILEDGKGKTYSGYVQIER